MPRGAIYFPASTSLTSSTVGERYPVEREVVPEPVLVPVPVPVLVSVVVVVCVVVVCVVVACVVSSVEELLPSGADVLTH